MRAGMKRYLELAGRYTQPQAPRLIIAHGLSGSGKTYVSQRLLERTAMIRVRSDVERKRLFGLGPLEPSGSARDDGIYTAEANTRTYDRLAELADVVLAAGFPVLVDAAFLKVAEREQFRYLAERRGAPFAIMHCEAAMAVQRDRVRARSRRGDDASEADLSILDRQIGFAEPLADAESGYTLVIDTTGEPELDDLLAWLASA